MPIADVARGQVIAVPGGGLTADTAGPVGGPLVILLHGFPQSRHAWRHQVPALAGQGFRAVAPDQRGYSAGLRPDPTTHLAGYHIDRLVGDVLDLAGALGAGASPFHLVGHDWGGQVAWHVAGRHPERVRSLTVLSRPHPSAFRRAFKENADDQQHRSRHHKAFHDPKTAASLLEDGARRLRSSLASGGVPSASIEEYVSVLGNTATLEAALAWYRAAGLLANMELGSISVPTLYVWGESDSSVGRAAAVWTADHVQGRYRFEALPLRGHFLTDEVPERITELLLEHFKGT